MAHHFRNGLHRRRMDETRKYFYKSFNWLLYFSFIHIVACHNLYIVLVLNETFYQVQPTCKAKFLKDFNRIVNYAQIYKQQRGSGEETSQDRQYFSPRQVWPLPLFGYNAYLGAATNADPALHKKMFPATKSFPQNTEGITLGFAYLFLNILLFRKASQFTWGNISRSPIFFSEAGMTFSFVWLQCLLGRRHQRWSGFAQKNASRNWAFSPKHRRNYLRICLPFFDHFAVQKSFSIHMRNHLKIVNIFLRSRYDL